VRRHSRRADHRQRVAPDARKLEKNASKVFDEQRRAELARVPCFVRHQEERDCHDELVLAAVGRRRS
jgi:hypothetical protein